MPGRLRRLRRAREPLVCATIFCGRDVGFAESGYRRAVPPEHGRETAIKLALMERDPGAGPFFLAFARKEWKTASKNLENGQLSAEAFSFEAGAQRSHNPRDNPN